MSTKSRFQGSEVILRKRDKVGLRGVVIDETPSGIFLQLSDKVVFVPLSEISEVVKFTNSSGRLEEADEDD